MKKCFLYFCVLVMTAEVYAQKTDSERIKITLTQYPQKPFESSVKSYDVKVVNTSTVQFSTVDITNKLRIEGLQFDRQHPDVLVVIAIDKVNLSQKVISETPPKDPNTPNVTPATSWFYTLEATMETSLRILSADMKYEYYPHKFNPMTSTIKSEPFPTEANAKKALGLYKPAAGTFNSLMNEAYFTFLDYANLNFGYRKIKEAVAINTIKSKDFDYADMDQALAKYKSAMEIYANNGLTDDSKNQLSESVAIWEKNVGEYQANDKKARINSKNITEIYLNLVAANIWLNRYEEAQKYLDLSANEKGNNGEKSQLNELIISRKVSYEQNLLREQNKLVLDKKISNLYSAPDFKVTTHPYRIKYQITSFSGGGTRRVYEYNHNGLLTKTYVQQLRSGIYKDTNQVDSVIYDHQNLTMSFYNIEDKKVTSTQKVKDGRVISTTGDIGNFTINYDKDGKLLGYVKVMGDKKEVTTYSYDHNKIKSIVQKDKEVGKDSVLNYKVDFNWANDKLLSTDGRYKNRYQYDASGRLASSMYKYDDYGNIIEIVEPQDDGSRYKELFEWENGSGNASLFKTAYPVAGPNFNPLLTPQVY
jgi:hypothetical protein